MSIARHHTEWLSLLDISGPFLSLKTLTSTFPQGLDAPDAAVTRELRLAYEEWLDATGGIRPDMALHRAWIEWTLRRVLGLPEETLVCRQGNANGNDGRFTVTVPEHAETLRPDIVIGEPGACGKPRILVQIVSPGQDLEKAPTQAIWQASPATRMMTLLRGTGVRLGLLTNGERWMLVDRPADENVTTGFASWYTRLWLDEPLTLRAFRSLLGAHRLFGVPEAQTLEALLTASADDRQEVTDQLGYQVRRAVELLVQAVDLADQNAGRALLTCVPPEQLYEASLVVMMRLVFLLFAEEQNLLLLGDDIYDRFYAASTLLEALREEADRHGEEVLERRFDAWARLLAIFRAVYGGFGHDRLWMPAYGGSLFNPDRYPFLEGRPEGTKWHQTSAHPLLISNRVVLHLLEALQVLRVRVRDGAPVETRRLSFRALDIEQIGHVYEGLLDHTALRTTEPVLGLAGTRDQEPEIPLATLESLGPSGNGNRASDLDKLINFLVEQTGRSANALRKAYVAPLDAFRASRLRAACGNDEELYARVLPFAALVRDDEYGRPVVIPAGSVYVTAGNERRSTGTHYTPLSLTEPIVRYTLEPLVYRGPAEGEPKENWKLRPAADLLQLTVCDMAMGSGAFLVQACRYLSERLLEAWAAAEEPRTKNSELSDKTLNTEYDTASHKRLITPEGFVTVNPDEAIPTDVEERQVFARRLIADRCLYGVDKNPLAVEMAKLSLWLITLAKGQPFSFLDHALRCGDSLLGISEIGQLTRWSLARNATGNEQQTSLITRQVEVALEVALRERHKIAGLRVRQARDADLKAGWLVTAEAALELVRLGADLLIAAALHLAPKMRQSKLIEWLPRYSLLLASAEDTRAGKLTIGGLTPGHEEFAALRHEADDLLAERKPFHWSLEFPEVLSRRSGVRAWGSFQVGHDTLLETAKHATLNSEPAIQNPGFSVIVGNPPFQGGKKITGTLGTAYRDYLVEHLADGRRGNADVCAYFFLRAGEMTQENGLFGLLATNTIAQGDTREVALDHLVQSGFTIARAVPSRPWPGLAAVEVAHVYLHRGTWPGPFALDDHTVDAISPFLSVPGANAGKPYRLKMNESKSFIGSYVLGMGFVLEPEEAQALIAKDSRNHDVLFPYLNGEDLNSRPDQSPSRWVINFQDWSLERAETYPDCMAIVREKVKPERTRQNDKGDFVLRKPLPQKWWIYGDKRPELYTTIGCMNRVLAITLHTKFAAFSFSKPNLVFTHGIGVIALDKDYIMSILCSSLYESWAFTYGSSLGETLRYTPSDCFETFPFPWKEYLVPDVQDSVFLDAIGKSYDIHRSQIMLARQEGLTKTYNRFHNPTEASADIAQLRRLHVEMDSAVAATYNWVDLDLGHGFHETKQGLRYTISEAARRMVLDRLLQLNHERYAEEVAAGLHEKSAKKAVGRGTKKPAQTTPSYTEAPQLVLDLGPSKPVVDTQKGAVIDFGEAIQERATQIPKDMRSDSVSPLSATTQLSLLDRHVILLARTMQIHRERRFEKTLGHVKAEKIAHLVEAVFDVDLGRHPVRDAAGPVDFQHLKQVLVRGKTLDVFEDRIRSGKQLGYLFEPRSNLDAMASRMHEAFGSRAAEIEAFIESLAGLNTRQTEIIATLYAAWNDLLADGAEVTDERLLHVFYAWHPDKRAFQADDIYRMKQRMVDDGIVPTGRAKRTTPLQK